MSNVIDIKTAIRDRVRVAMFEFSAVESNLAFANLRLCMLNNVRVVDDVRVASDCDVGYIRDQLRVGVYS